MNNHPNPSNLPVEVQKRKKWASTLIILIPIIGIFINLFVPMLGRLSALSMLVNYGLYTAVFSILYGLASTPVNRKATGLLLISPILFYLATFQNPEQGFLLIVFKVLEFVATALYVYALYLLKSHNPQLTKSQQNWMIVLMLLVIFGFLQSLATTILAAGGKLGMSFVLWGGLSFLVITILKICGYLSLIRSEIYNGKRV